MTRKQLIVSSNRDSGAGSLRQALAETQKRDGGQFDIVFRSNAKANNKLTTGFFTIALESPLPVIYRNDVQINVTSPRSVILVPEQASKSPEASSGLMNSKGAGRVNGSMLYVGDTNYLYEQKSHYKGNNLPNVKINNVSFIRNNAKGGSGSAGSGGGLGTGGAITLLAGDLEVTNSIFQGLKAEGGSGGSATTGGQGSVFFDLVPKAKPTDGANGGTGGVSSIPIRTDSSGNSSFGQLAAAGGAGGARGTGNKICNGDEGAKHDGEAGKPGASTSVFGMGGGGGGAGGGGAVSFDKTFLVCGISPTLKVHPGGKGGVGGDGGLFAGHGGRGGSGGRANLKNLFGQGPANGSPSKGSSGADGQSIGAAIAIWNKHAQRFSGQNISANLSLDNVSFYNNSADRNEVFSDIGKFISINNVFDGSGRNDRDPVTVNDFSFGLPFRVVKPSSSENKPPIFFGLSVPRVETVADVSDTILQASDLSDQFYIGYEDRSTVAGITTDLTNEDNPLNKLWKELVPDKSSDILEDYQSKANQSYTDAMFSPERNAKRGDKILKSLAKEAIGMPFKAGLGKVKGFGASTAAGAVTDLAEDHIKYMNEKVMLERNRDEALEENLKIQDELARTLEEQSSAQLSSVQLDLQRSKVIIKDFSLGNDNVTLPKGPGNPPIGFDLSNNRGKTVVSMKYDTGSNADLPFVSIELDRKSSNALTAHANNASPEQYLSSMLVNNDNNDKILLGSNLALPLVIEGESFSSGPAGTTLIVDRNANQRSLTDRISLNTSTGRDAIYGSDGLEVVNTGANEDIIFPGLGGDDINGGPGSDLVSYVVRPQSTASPEPLHLVAKSNQSIRVSKSVDCKTRDCKVGQLRNIEDFHLFGDSTVDLSALNVDEIQRSVVSGSGSNLTGSGGKEVFQISFYDDYNNSVADAYASTTTVDGGRGFDRLIVDTENAPFKVGFVHEGGELILFSESDDSVLLRASGIESFAGIGSARASDRSVEDFTPGRGTSGNDLLIGTSSKDTLSGLGGDDTFIGGDGNDILEAGGIGINIFVGGPGRDTYILPTSGGLQNTIIQDADKDKDKVINFDPNRDSILFSNIAEISASSDRLKRAKKAGHNVILKVKRPKNISQLLKSGSFIFYRNDGSDRYSRLKFPSILFDDFDLISLNDSSHLDAPGLVGIASHLV